jgi:5-methylcytosine-specific restriction endonuclease McrA
MSTIEVYPIIALHGSARVNLFDRIPTYSRHKLCRRDRFMCAYCGDVRPERELSADHIVPQAQGGRWCWTNLVTACKGCNGVKGNRTPEQAGMPLLYLPYVPNLFEDFLLKGRNIRADVHVWLASRLPRGSRLQ